MIARKDNKKVAVAAISKKGVSADALDKFFDLIVS